LADTAFQKRVWALKAPISPTTGERRPGRPPSGAASFSRAHAVINLQSGTAAGSPPDELEKILTSAFGEGGRKLTVEVVEPGQVEAQLREAARGDAEVIIAGGGDGTVRTAASLLVNSHKILGILPLGTLNRLARDLGIPLDPQQAALTLAQAEVTAIDVAMVQDRVFLCQSMIGLASDVTEHRQRWRGRPLGQRLAGYARLLSHLWRARRRLSLVVEDANEKRVVRAMSVVVANNCYAERPSLMLHRPRLNQGCLGLYIAKHRRGSAALGALFNAALGRWRSDPNIEHMRERSIVVDAFPPRVKASNDGELEILTSPLTYAIRPLALRVLVPPSSPGC
jgi:diacylglycerol kinase family enzyme